MATDLTGIGGAIFQGANSPSTLCPNIEAYDGEKPTLIDSGADITLPVVLQDVRPLRGSNPWCVIPKGRFIAVSGSYRTIANGGDQVGYVYNANDAAAKVVTPSGDYCAANEIVTYPANVPIGYMPLEVFRNNTYYTNLKDGDVYVAPQTRRALILPYISVVTSPASSSASHTAGADTVITLGNSRVAAGKMTVTTTGAEGTLTMGVHYGVDFYNGTVVIKGICASGTVTVSYYYFNRTNTNSISSSVDNRYTHVWSPDNSLKAGDSVMSDWVGNLRKMYSDQSGAMFYSASFGDSREKWLTQKVGKVLTIIDSTTPESHLAYTKTQAGRVGSGTTGFTHALYLTGTLKYAIINIDTRT